VEFNLADLQVGRRKWRSGKSGPQLKLDASQLGLPPKPIQRREVVLRGKLLLGRQRFAFEILEVDYSPEAVASVLKKAHMKDVPATSWLGAHLAKDRSPLHSLQVKFEDVQSLQCERVGEVDVVTLHLKKAVSCYIKPAGQARCVQLEVGNDITNGAKTIRFTTASPLAAEENGRASQKSQIDFAQARAIGMEHSVQLHALFTGTPAPLQVVTPKKRKSTAEAPATIAKCLKKDAQGSAKVDTAILDPDAAKAALNKRVKDMAFTVDMDWHDSYEQTDEMLHDWFEACGEQAKLVLRSATDLGAGFGKAHEILKCVSDTWDNINAIPFRCPPVDSLAEACIDLIEDGDSEDGSDTSREHRDISPRRVGTIEDMMAIVWPVLLARAAGDDSVPDKSLNQMLKDAQDNGVKSPHVAHPSEQEVVAREKAPVRAAVAKGRARLADLASKEDWKKLPCTVKTHRMRRCIDRRFDGPKHLRTRDFGSDSDDDGARCSIM